MAKQTPLEKRIKSVLNYDATRPYFGKFAFSELYSAQGFLRRNEYYDAIGSRDTRVWIGKIDGNVICGALYRLMGYNPGRFTENPFLYDGKNNIFKFVNDITLPADTITADIITGLRCKLREYLTLNATRRGQWQDEIPTNDGFVLTVLNDGRAGPTYKKLCLLRDAVKLITKQNCTDFDKKRGPYRAQIICVMEQLHPEIFDTPQAAVPAQTPSPDSLSTQAPAPISVQKSVPVEHRQTDDKMDKVQNVVAPVKPEPVRVESQPTNEDIATDKIYEKMEHLQITLDNRANVSPELYEQARAEFAQLSQELYTIRNQHTL